MWFAVAIVVEVEGDIFARKLDISRFIEYLSQLDHGHVEHTIPVAPIGVSTFGRSGASTGAC